MLFVKLAAHRVPGHGSVPKVLLTLVVVAAVLAGCSTTPSEGALVHNKQLVRRMNAEVWNGADIDHLEDYFTPHFVLHFLPDGSDSTGMDSLREHVRELHAAFPDWREDIQRIIAEGDLVVIHYVSSGTNRGPWLGRPPTGRRVRLDETSIFRIEDGRIAEQWLLPDVFTMERQLVGGDG